jgi:hypothetical protein
MFGVFSINARCLDSYYELKKARFDIQPFDGANWEANASSIQQ